MKPEEFEVYVIPPNFMEGGTLFGGLLKTRNTIEAVILGLAVGVPVLHLPFSLTVRVVILCLTALPLVLLALIGVSGMSLSAFIRLFFCFLHNRRILSRDGTQGGKNGKTLLPSWAQQRKSDCEAEDPPLPKSRSRFSVDLKQRSVTQFKTFLQEEEAVQPLNALADYIPIEKIEHGVIYTRDHRYVKVVEVVPVNFLLRSAREQRSIIYSFISYLKIAPVKMQFKALTKRADINRHLDTVRRELEHEQDPRCRVLQEDYLKLIRQLGSREAITRRFFLVFEYEPLTETVTVNTAKNDLAQILAELSPSMPYEKDGFSGELALDHTTLSTEASGYTTKYSKTTETKVIGNLDRNDMSYVPATTVKNGKTLSLANVEWQVTGTALVGEALVPAQYQAVATYSASSSYQAATGYVTTAEYHGTVTSEGVDSITYTVVYTGSEIVPVKTHIWDNGNLAAPLLIIAAVLLCAGIAAAALILLRRRKNVYVYVPDSKPREYRLIAKFRVEPDSEVPAIDAGALTLNPGDTVAVEVKKSLARHLAGREFTVSFPQSDYTYTIQASKHNDWHEFTVPAEEEQEAPV